MAEANNLNFSLDSLGDSNNSSGWGLNFWNSWGGTLDVNNSSIDNGNISLEEDPQEKEAKTISHKIRLFVISSIIVIIDLLIWAIFFAFNFYQTEISKPKPNTQYKVFFDNYNKFTNFLATYIPALNHQTYKNLPLVTQENEANFTRIINATELSYTDKKNIIEPALSSIISNTNIKIDALEEINSTIVKNYFLPQEIRDILGEKGTTDLQRALSSLEIIKFNTASKVFVYLDSILNLLSDKTGLTKEDIITLLNKVTARGESDFFSYVYMCYFNPYETSSECNTIGDLDIYYKDILKDEETNIVAFKKIMSYLDSILEQTDIPNFSIIFHTFDPIREVIDFSVEVNLTKEDEKWLVKQGIKNPNIYILTNIINGLKQSVFVLWADIDAKSITVDTRTITDWSTSYIVKTSQKEFSLPVQKSSEREIFDYVNDEFINQLKETIQKSKEEALQQLLEETYLEEEIEWEEEWEEEFEDENTEEEENSEEFEEIEETEENNNEEEKSEWDENEEGETEFEEENEIPEEREEDNEDFSEEHWSWDTDEDKDNISDEELIEEREDDTFENTEENYEELEEENIEQEDEDLIEE